MRTREWLRRSYLVDRARSFRFAGAGLLRLLREERNARIHLLAAVLVVAAGFRLGLDALEWAIIALAIGGVVSAEALNSAVERVADAVSKESHPLIGAAKDLAAAAVLLMALAALTVGVLVFGRHLFG